MNFEPNKFVQEESATLELKREPPTHNQIAKTVVAFANRLGGKLIIGIEDSGVVVGLAEETAHGLLESLGESIFRACTPTILPNIYTQRFNDRPVVVVEVAEGMQKPYYLTAEGSTKGCYIRVGRSTIRTDLPTIENLKWQSRGRSMDEQPLFQAALKDLDQSGILKLFKSKGYHEQQEFQRLSALREFKFVYDEQHKSYPTVGAVLLFGQNPQQFFPEATILLSEFKNDVGREIISSIECTGTLFDQIEKAYQFVIGHLPRAMIFKDQAKREDRSEVPEIAIREALINCVAHRDYSINGSIKIAIFPSRLEFFSPGNFPGLLSVRELESGISYIRNHVICRVLREAGYVEKLGTGFQTIFSSYRKANLLTPSVIEGDGYIKYILPRTRKAQLPQINSLEGQILELIQRRGEISTRDIVSSLKISRATVGRVLNKLVLSKKIIRFGHGSSVRYSRLT
jgi:ATP-dependent DNA helicase RecG